MRAIKYILIFLCFSVFGQNWDAVYTGSTEINRIYSGGTLVWEKVEYYWDYEGVMTVGEYSDASQTVTGYSKYEYGAMNPVIPTIIDDAYIGHLSFTSEPEFNNLFVYFEKDGISYLDSNEDVIISINGDIDTLIYSELWGDHQILLSNTPFPASGETCDIKLKYTLAP